MSPHAVLVGEGTLHVLWAEPMSDWRPVLRRDWIVTLMHSASLWHATYTTRRGWSRPVRVYAAEQIWWSEGTGDVVPDPTEGLHAVIGDDTAQALVHLAYDGREWRSAPIPGMELPSYASIAVDSGGRLYVAYVGAAPNTASDANSVFLVRSPDGGWTWLPPRLISLSGTRQATQIRVLPTSGGTVHLVWAQNVSGGLMPQVIRHVVSRDDGETWSAAEDLDIPDGLGSMGAAVDRCGAVHVTYAATVYDEDGVDEQGRLWYARWNGGWSALELPFGKLNFTEGALAADPDEGALRLVGTVIRPGATLYETTYETVVSHGQVTR